MSYKRISAVYAVDTFLFTPFRTFASLYFLKRMDAILVGKLFTLSNVGRMIGTAIAGPLVDRIGRKPVMLVFYVASILVFPLVFLNPRLFYPLASCLRSVYNVAGEVMIYEGVPEEEPKAFGYALSLSFSDVSYIASLLGYSYLYDNSVDGIVNRTKIFFIPAAILGAALIMSARVPDIKAKRSVRYLEILSDKRVLTYLALVSAYRLFAPFIFIFGVPILYYKGLTVRDISIILSITAFIEIFLSPIASKSASITTLYFIGQVMRMGARACVPFVHDRIILMGLYTLSVLAYSLIGPSGETIDASIFPDEARGSGISLIRLSTTLTYTLGSYIAGYLYEYFGAISLTFIAIILLTMGASIARYVRKTRKI